MNHFTNPTTIAIMVFYSLLTFFLGPMVSGMLMKEHPDPCVGGFLLGFTASVLLWMKFGRHYAK